MGYPPEFLLAFCAEAGINANAARADVTKIFFMYRRCFIYLQMNSLLFVLHFFGINSSQSLREWR